MKKDEDKNNKKELAIEFLPSSTTSSKEEDDDRLAKFLYTLIEIDLEQKTKILEKQTQQCNVCKKEILELDDFGRKDNKTYCRICLPRNNK